MPETPAGVETAPDESLVELARELDELMAGPPAAVEAAAHADAVPDPLAEP